MIGIICLFSAGYAAFSSNFLVSGKGTIKDVKFEVDSKVPLDNLLFWGQADNKENTDLIFKDKSKHQDGELCNFNSTENSGFNVEGLIFDGIDDYVKIGYANYDFKNSISYVMFLKLNSLDKAYNLFGAWGSAGGGLEYHSGTKNITMDIQPISGSGWHYANAKENSILDHYYTLVGIYDGINIKLYIDGDLQEETPVESMKNSTYDINIGAALNNGLATASNITLKEAMLYDRALTEDEVKILTDGFQKKYLK